MSGLPAEWAEVQIGALMAPLPDGRLLHHGWSPQCEKGPSEREDVWGVLKTTAVQAGAFHPAHNKRLPDALTPRPTLEVSVGDLLVTSAGPRARCGVACLVRTTRPHLILSGKMYRFRPDTRLADPRYLEAYLVSPSATRAVDGMKTGISDSGLNLTRDRFSKLRVPLPPLNEQRRIVAAIEEHLSRLDAADASLAAALRRLDGLNSSTLAAAATGHSTEELGSVTSSHRYGTSVKCVSEEVGPPVLRIPNVRGGRVDLTDLKYATDDVGDSYVEADDLLFIRTNGSRDLIGRVAVADGAAGMAFASYLIRASPDTSLLDPRWAVIALSSPRLRATIEARAASTAGQYNLNLKALRSLDIPLPPLEEQKRIVAEVEERLSKIDVMRASIERAQRRSKALRAAILERAFRGELVPQDPSDEPAEALLARIRAEPGAGPVSSGRGRRRG